LKPDVALNGRLEPGALRAFAGAVFAAAFRVGTATVYAVKGVPLAAAIPAFIVAGVDAVMGVLIEGVEKEVLFADLEHGD
jgi:hypothetical protein